MNESHATAKVSWQAFVLSFFFRFIFLLSVDSFCICGSPSDSLSLSFTLAIFFVLLSSISLVFHRLRFVNSCMLNLKEKEKERDTDTQIEKKVYMAKTCAQRCVRRIRIIG